MTPVGVFFICQNEDKCHFVNSTELRHILKSAPPMTHGGAVDGFADAALDAPRSQYGKSR